MTLTLLEKRSDHRAALVRKAMIHVPATIGALAISAALFVSLLQGNLGVLIGLTIIGIIGFAVGFEANASLRDLQAEPVTTRGEVLRAWSKGRFLFIGTIFYVHVGGRVFELERPTFANIENGDTLEIVHWPRTNIIITLHLVEGLSADGNGRER
ncbi:MAG: hypothetical protein V3S31_05125 [Dehalococcoidia bacterium]